MTSEFNVSAYAAVIEARIMAGWLPNLLTFMFEPLQGGERAIQAQQRRIVESVYARFLTRVVRHPRAISQLGTLPVWICAPDFPVAKHARQRLRDVSINDGQHMHGVAMLPPGRRVTDMCAHVHDCQALYTGVTGVMRLDAQAITHNVEYVVGYAAKMITRGRVDPDALLVLPRAHSEVNAGNCKIGRNASIFASGPKPG